MKNTVFSVLILLSAVFLSSCISTNINHAESNSQISFSDSWTDSDFRHVTESLIQDCVNSTGVNNYKNNGEELPRVIIGKITNKSEGHIDSSKLVRRFQTAIINSGAMKIVSSSEHTASQNDEIDEYYAFDKLKQTALELGADFILCGTVHSKTENKENQHIYTFLIDMELFDIHNDCVLWQGVNDDIKKRSSGPRI